MVSWLQCPLCEKEAQHYETHIAECEGPIVSRHVIACLQGQLKRAQDNLEVMRGYKERAEARLLTRAQHPDVIWALTKQHNIIMNILTDSQLDTKGACGQTIREYTDAMANLMMKLKEENA